MVIWIDIDHVKEFCDREGYQAGDRAIALIARVIQDAGGDGATHRVGGDEFLIALPGARLEAVAQLAERIRAAVGKAAPLTISAGVAWGASVSEAWQRAESRVTLAKLAGRDAVSVDALSDGSV